MNLTSKSRYAVTAMLDLAMHSDNGAVSLGEISARQGISQSYLEQLFSKLRQAGLVVSTRGPGGGYALVKSAQDTSVADIIQAVDEPVENTSCHGTVDCNESDHCLAHQLWYKLSEEIRGFLAGTSLWDLLQQEAIQKVARRQDKMQTDKISFYR